MRKGNRGEIEKKGCVCNGEIIKRNGKNEEKLTMYSFILIIHALTISFIALHSLESNVSCNFLYRIKKKNAENWTINFVEWR